MENLIKNAWALGIDNSSGCPGDIHFGWTHSETVSLSRCPKNPSPDGAGHPGAAFKNGPVQGPGKPEIETISTQEFVLSEAESHTLQFSSLIMQVRAEYLHVDLYGNNDDDEHLGNLYLGRLLNYDPDTSVPDYYQDGGERGDWPGFIGPELVVAHYDIYRIEIRTLFTMPNSLGIKWTGLRLEEK